MPAPSSAARVEEAATGDREHEGAELLLTAVELRQPASDLEPDLRCDVFGVHRCACREVTQDTRLQRSVQARDRPLFADPRRREHPAELVAEEDSHGTFMRGPRRSTSYPGRANCQLADGRVEKCSRAVLSTGRRRSFDLH
jgi:hypothetical protein